MEKKKFELVDTERVLFGAVGNSSIGNDLEKAGCYVVDLGKLVVKVAPQLPYNGERFRPTIRQVVDITNEVVWTLQETILKCSGKTFEMPGFGFMKPILQLAGCRWWERRPA